MTDYLVKTADEIRVARAHAGAELCRAAIAAVVARRQVERDVVVVPLSRSEEILQRARQRADEERRAARQGAAA